MSFSGSLIAFAKLQGLITKSLRFGGQKILNWRSCSSPMVLGFMVVAGTDPSGLPAVSLFFVVRADSRGRHDAADRRRGHAGRHLAVQRFTGLAVGFEASCSTTWP